MKFLDQELRIMLELIQIDGTDFWKDGDGDLYLATHGTCERISAERAVKALLKRENMKKVVCCHKEGIGLKNVSHWDMIPWL